MTDTNKPVEKEAAPPSAPNSNTEERGQGTEDTDGNGRNFTGQGSQKEGSSKQAEGTGYKK
ncbi:MAG TPA: hypothetical protein VM100_11060 [Longimicrobiales bacterium]|nr:hypothetical protein [Longimicrobiales bacterium]